MKTSSLLIALALLGAWSIVVAQDVGDEAAEVAGTGETEDPPSVKPSVAYKQRRRESRKPSKNDERMKAALEWLVDHQAKDGSWSPHTFQDDTTRSTAVKTYNIEFRGVGEASGDRGWKRDEEIGIEEPVIGVTGLALQAFTAAGYDHLSGDYQEAVRAGLDFLLKHQLAEGEFVSLKQRHFAYEQASATVAVAELYGLTGDPKLKAPLQTACKCIMAAQNPGLGWRYESQAAVNDTSCTGNMMLALTVAKLAGLELDTRQVEKDVLDWFDLVCVKVNGVWKTGYDSPGSNNSRLLRWKPDKADGFDHNECLDAIHGVTKFDFGKKTSRDARLVDMRQSVDYGRRSVEWEQGKIDFQFWYWGTRFMKACGDKYWKNWRTPLASALLEHQRGFCDADVKNGRTNAAALDEHGSWDAVSAWSEAGGRVYTTAMAAITLEMLDD